MDLPRLRWEWLRFEDLGVHRLYAALALRMRVFILEQGPYQDADGLDAHAWHLLGWTDDGGPPALGAYLRVVDPGHKFDEPSIGRVIVAPELRGTGTGRRLMETGLARCDEAWPGRPNRISAQAHLERFYGSLGYLRVAPDHIEDGIPHVEMTRPAR